MAKKEFVKQQQDEISRNHVPSLFAVSVHIFWEFGQNLLLKRDAHAAAWF